MQEDSTQTAPDIEKITTKLLEAIEALQSVLDALNGDKESSSLKGEGQKSEGCTADKFAAAVAEAFRK